jgi:hypothetical protein
LLPPAKAKVRVSPLTERGERKELMLKSTAEGFDVDLMGKSKTNVTSLQKEMKQLLFFTDGLSPIPPYIQCVANIFIIIKHHHRC